MSSRTALFVVTYAIVFFLVIVVSFISVALFAPVVSLLVTMVVSALLGAGAGLILSKS